MDSGPMGGYLSLRDHGVAVFKLSPGLLESHAWHSLGPIFETLPRDAYYAHGVRRRTLNPAVATIGERFDVRFSTKAAPYVQSQALNPEMMGSHRLYAPSAAIHNNEAIVQILRNNFEHIARCVEARRFRINVHAIRYTATPEAPVNNSPRGFHKDGERFISVHLVSILAVDGGHSEVVDNARAALFHGKLEEPGDSLLIDDERTWHAVSEMRCLEGSTIAHRDILLIDHIPDPPSRA